MNNTKKEGNLKDPPDSGDLPLSYAFSRYQGVYLF